MLDHLLVMHLSPGAFPVPSAQSLAHLIELAAPLLFER